MIKEAYLRGPDVSQNPKKLKLINGDGGQRRFYDTKEWNLCNIGFSVKL